MVRSTIAVVGSIIDRSRGREGVRRGRAGRETADRREKTLRLTTRSSNEFAQFHVVS